MCHRFFLTQPNGVIQRAQEKGLSWISFRIFLYGESNGVSLRLLNYEKRDVEQRECAAGHLDLACHGFDALFIGHKCNVDFRQRLGRFATFGKAPAVVAALATAVVASGATALALITARTASFVARAATK